MTADTKAQTENRGEIHLEVLLSIDRGARDARRVRFAVLKDGANTDVPPDTAQILQQLFDSDLRVRQTVIEVIDHRHAAPALVMAGAGKPAILEDPYAEVISPSRAISIKPRINPHWTRDGAEAANARDGIFEVDRAKPGRRLGGVVGDRVPRSLHGANGIAAGILTLGGLWALWGAVGALS